MNAETTDAALSDEAAFAIGVATAKAARAAAHHVGRGDERAADGAAIEAMRAALNAMAMDARIVIGEGERAEAPLLYVGEEVGSKLGPAFDLGVDPLEGTTLTAKAMPNALSCIAMTARGGLMQAPHVYLEKLAIGPGYSEGVVDLDAPIADNVLALAKAKGVKACDIGVCVLDRPRHAKIIDALRAVGARVMLISDGDVAGVIWTTDPETGIDLYVGQGGASEGVLAAAALKCAGGQFQARFVARNDGERARLRAAGIADPDRRLALHDLVSSDAIFAASGVTDGLLLSGVRKRGRQVDTHTLVMNSATGLNAALYCKTQAP